MARKRKDATERPQTAASLEEVARQLDQMSGQLRGLVELLKATPSVAEFLVPWDGSRESGIKSLQTWIAGAHKSAFGVIYEATRPVSDSRGSVSEPHINGREPRKKSPKKDGR